jgi:DNA helicase-2/ATP-dependent DNA helicase PcrA
MSQAKRSSDGMSLRIVDVLADIEHRPEAQTFHALERLLQARDLLLDLKGKTDTLTLPELAERLMKESGLIPSDPNATDPLDLMALTEFFDHIKSRGYEDPRFSLGELLVDLEYRQQYGLKLQYDVPHLVDDGIQLMTAHGSKGLEFDTVIVMNFREKHWDHRRPMPGLALPEELLFGGSLAEGLEDERRLAYVAWTRARRELILSCPERMVRGEREQDCSPSAFAIEGGPLIEELTPLREPIRANVLTLPQTKIDGALASFLRSKLEKFELSVTALNHFLEDPQIFLAQDLLGLPQAKSATLSYGTAVHEGLREWARVAKDTGVSSEEALLEGFKTAMTEREILTETERRRLVHLGEKALPRYFAARLQTAPIIWATEKRLTARLGDIRLKGLIDRLDLYHIDGAKVRVIDYKTGSPKSEREIREEESGNLYRQLVFYKLLIERAIETLGYEPVEFSLEFIGERDVEPSSVTFEIPTADVTALESVIEKVWAKIMALDFTPLDGEILPS